MRRGRGSWWWTQITRALVYLALGIVSAGLAVLMASRYPPLIRVGIMVLTWILGMLVIDIRVHSEPVEGEEDP